MLGESKLWVSSICQQNLCTRTNTVLPHYLRSVQVQFLDLVDNRPSTNKLHHFVKKTQRKTKTMWHVTCDMWHVTCDTWHVTRDTWHVTHDTWHMTCLGGGRGVNILSKFQLPSSYCLWFVILWRSGEIGSRTDWLIESRGCLKNSTSYSGSVKKYAKTKKNQVVTKHSKKNSSLNFYVNGFFLTQSFWSLWPNEKQRFWMEYTEITNFSFIFIFYYYFKLMNEQ